MYKILTFIYLLFLGSVLLSTASWAQEAANGEAAEPTSVDSTEPKDKKAPIRLSSRLPRSTLALDRTRKMKLLENNLYSGTPYWLNDGKEDFLVIWQEDRSGDAQGALLILHAEGEHPSWPRTTQPLHDSLPEYGWATMAIQLPNPAYQPTPLRTLAAKTIPPKENRDITNNDTGDQKEEKIQTKKDESLQKKPEKTTPKAPMLSSQDIETITANRLTATLKFLHDKGQFNIVLMGSGTGAIRGHKLMKSIAPIIENKLLRKKIEKPIRGSIIFNARNTLPTESEPYTDWFFDTEIPILDIYLDTDLRNISDAKLRKALAKKQKVITHKSIKLSNLSYEKSWQENQLSRRIRSFLVTYVKGIEVDNAKIKK
ncbi:MAG: hypothetical protein ACJA0C_000675 [Candidatus Endobugula sp.]|jgi:hypothetical protein